MASEGQIYGQNSQFRAKFHVCRGNVSPLRGEKPIFWTTE